MQMLRELKAAAAIPGEAGAEVGSGLACGGLESDKGMTGGRQEAVRQPGGRRATFSPPPEACGLSKPSPARRRPGGAGVPGSRILSVGLIALVGVLSGGLPSMAQVTTACTPPAGLPPLADPPVTAQQVETGTGSLKDFALAVREQARAHARRAAAVEEGVYIACVMRQEGGPWRWGATYNVSLTLDGRVFVHAKDMALSGRLLNQSLYREILAALGVSRTDLADLASPDPAARSSALNSIFATLSREPDAPFDATSPLPGVRPGIPGASGYASVYVSSEFRSPIVLLAGFDIDASHMEEERLDFGDPAVTAREVVDRETLKAFVTQAGNWFLEISEAGDPDVASRARIALRDPNGPWRHGSVYLYVLDTVSDVIVFHGAFPNQWEYRPLNPTARDTVTGELILPQIIAAAKSGPEGGFVEYHFDDPADDSDSAEIPKVGYAREFSGQIRRLDGNTVPLSFIVGSGIYNAVADSGATEAVANDDQMPTAWLSRFGRTVAEQALDGVAARIATPRMPGLDATLAGHAVGPGTDDAAGMTPTERRAARAERDAARAMAELARALAPDADPEDRFGEGLAARGAQSLDGDGALAGTAFTLTTGTDGAGGTTAFWGRAAVTGFDGRAGTFSLDGEAVTLMLGADHARGRWLAGLALLSSSGEGGYADSGAGSVHCAQPLDADTRQVLCDGAVREGDGTMEVSLTAAVPYAALQASERMRLWAALGRGTGEMTLRPETGGTLVSGIDWSMAAAGLRGELLPHGGLSLAVTSDALWTRTDSERTGQLAASGSDTSRLLLGLEGSWTMALDGGSSLSPRLELGLRHDGGDAETGFGVEAGGGVTWRDPHSGLSLGLSARKLLAHESDDLDDWGTSLDLAWDPRPDTGRGWSARLSRSHGGASSGGVAALLDPSVFPDAGNGGGGAWSAEAAHGTSMGRGMVGGPYARASGTIGTKGEVRTGYRIGPEGAHAEDVTVDLWAEPGTGEAGSAVGAGVEWRW